MRKEVADSNLYECQPPLRLKPHFLHTKWRGGCLSTVMSSHLSTGLPITHHGLSAIDTKSAHGVRRCKLGTPWADLVSMADSPWCVKGKTPIFSLTVTKVHSSHLCLRGLSHECVRWSVYADSESIYPLRSLFTLGALWLASKGGAKRSV
jgi:hypothetical protein